MPMGQGLFCQEAIDARRSQWLGTIRVVTPLSRWIWTALGTALAVAIVVFLVFGHYIRRARVSGQLVSNTDLFGVTVTHEGTIARIDMHQGDHVHQGQPLMDISSEQDNAMFGSVRADISRQLRSQRKRLRNDLTLQKQRGPFVTMVVSLLKPPA